MELTVLFITINLLVIIFTVFMLVKNVKQRRFNRLLINFKIQNKMVVYKKPQKNKWNNRLAYLWSFTLLFNGVNAYYFVNNPYLYGGMKNNKTDAINSSVASSSNAASSLVTNPENVCVYDEDKGSYIEKDSCIIPSIDTNSQRKD
jgi:hypothetical protein